MIETYTEAFATLIANGPAQIVLPLRSATGQTTLSDLGTAVDDFTYETAYSEDPVRLTDIREGWDRVIVAIARKPENIGVVACWDAFKGRAAGNAGLGVSRALYALSGVRDDIDTFIVFDEQAWDAPVQNVIADLGLEVVLDWILGNGYCPAGFSVGWDDGKVIVSGDDWQLRPGYSVWDFAHMSAWVDSKVVFD